MTLPPELGWMDAAFLATLSIFLLAWVQYWKKSLPETEWVVRAFSFLSALGFSYLLNSVMRAPDEQLSLLAIILYGVAAAIFSDFGYQFFSSSRSSAFTLPSQTQLKNGVNPVAEKEKKVMAKQQEILKQFEELNKLKESIMPIGVVSSAKIDK